MPEAQIPAQRASIGSRPLKLQLVRSIIGCTVRQRATVEALGLKRMHQVVIQTDSPATRGMVKKVAHLVRIVEDS